MTHAEELLKGRGLPTDPLYIKFIEENCDVPLHITPRDLVRYDVSLAPPFPYASAYIRCNADGQENPERMLPKHYTLFFKDCSLRHTDFARTHRPAPYSRFLNCDLTGATFSRAKAQRLSFVNCNLTRVDFSCSDLSGVLFVDCDLTKTNFVESSLWAAAFAGCNTQDAYFYYANAVTGSLHLPGYRESRVTWQEEGVLFGLDSSWLETEAVALGAPRGLAEIIAAEHIHLSPTEVLKLCHATVA